MEEKNNFIKYLKLVGTGKKHNRDLTKEEMKKAMHLILSGKIEKENIGAFLLGLRIKGETIDECIGVLDTFDTFIKKISLPNSIELGFPFDGKADNPYLLPLTAKYLGHCDVNLVLCVDNFNNAKHGLTTYEISKNFQNKNLYFINRDQVFSELSSLNTLRENLHIRTILNSLEKLTCFASSNTGAIGVFHMPFVEKYINIYKHKYEKFAVIKGNEGSMEIFSKTKVWVRKKDIIEEITVDPLDFGINYQKSYKKIEREESLRMTKAPTEELFKLAKLNAAVLLYLYRDEYKSIGDAFDKIDIYQ